MNLSVNLPTKNATYIQLLETLSNIMSKKGEPFRAKAYQKAAESIMMLPNDIQDVKQLSNLSGIGPAIVEKLKEYDSTGKIQAIENSKNDPVHVLMDVYGIGPKKAKELVESGITTIALLRQNQNLLNTSQKTGLMYYEDILLRIPRTEIDEYKGLFQNAILATNLTFEIVGSYRRGLLSSGDIDVILTHKNASEIHHDEIFRSFVKKLVKQGVILEILSQGCSKCLVIARLPNKSARRVDFLYTPNNEYYFSILYFTGSKIFNTMMRNVALERGYTMNEHGIYKMTEGVKGECINMAFQSEKNIFQFLGLVYKEPFERVDGRAIQFIGDLHNNPLPELDKYKKFGVHFLKGCDEKTLLFMINKAKHHYYNLGECLLTDNQYDVLEDFAKNKCPKISIKTDAPMGSSSKKTVALPYNMPSMDKIKPDTNALSQWCKKFGGPFLLSCKLDGISALYVKRKGREFLYTRGEEGVMGVDIQHLLPFLDIMKTQSNDDVAIRGEIIMTKHAFETKYKTNYSNGRNLVIGIVNSLEKDERVYDLHFVAYEVIYPAMKPSEQMAVLFKNVHKVVYYQIVERIDNLFLSELLVQYRSQYAYTIDGIIVSDDKIYERTNSNPEHSFAFKMVLNDQKAECSVVDVLWEASKDGYLKPRVQVAPVCIGGVVIKYATGFNAQFIEQNKIGIGAVITMVRSGDVIPFIQNVVVPCSDGGKMPDVDYVWNDTHVDVIVQDKENNQTVQMKKICGFFVKLGVEGLGEGNIKRIMQAGFDSVPKIIKMKIEDFLKVQGFKMKMAEKIYEGIRLKIQEASLLLLVIACSFGRGLGEKKLELILEHIPDIFISTETDAQKTNRLLNIKGIEMKTANLFIQGVSPFLQFLDDCGLREKCGVLVISKKEGDGHPLHKKIVVLTGFRDANMEASLKNWGAILGTSVSSNTFCVVAKDVKGDSGKISGAKKLGIPVLSVEEFKATYCTF
jgi:NAD-dependent DNA ligase/DNA polymerase/3'-5' exonuclease PolX